MSKSIKSKQQIQTEQQFLYTLAKVMEAFPQYSISQHLTHFLRRKGEKQEVYFWKDDMLLNKLENYYDELKSEFIHTIEED